MLSTRDIAGNVLADDRTATYVDGDVAAGEVVHMDAGVVLVVGTHDAVSGISVGVEAVAHRGQTAATVDGAEHGAAGDVDGDVATHVAGGQGVATETAAAAEDVAVDVGGAPGAYISVGLDFHQNVTHDVTILAAAEDRAVNTAAVDGDTDFLDVGAGVEAHALVALAGTKEVAGDGVSLDLREGAGHTEGATAEDDGAGVENVAQLAAAIEACEDVTAGNLDTGVTHDTACRLYIDGGVGIVGNISGLVGHHTRTTTEDVAVEGMAVVGSGILIVIIGVVWGAERPVATLIEELGVVRGDIVSPLCSCVDTV